MPYKLCCSSPKKISYSLRHTILSCYEQKTAIAMLLYLPEIDSFQADRGTTFLNDVYENYFIEEIKKLLGLHDDDFEINISAPDRTIDDTIAHFYEGIICLNCSKVNIAQCKGRNKVVSFFTRLRDMIAHGYFNFVEDMFIGFDHPKFGSAKYSGVIKAKVNNLNILIDTFASMSTTSGLFRYVLSKHGYAIFDSAANYDDFMVEKDGRRYFLEFKSFKGRYINQEDLNIYLKQREYIDKTNCMFILIVDSTYTNSKINSILLDYNVSVLDKSWIKEMMNGDDVLLELTETIKQARK